MKRGAFPSVVQMAAADSNEFLGTKEVESLHFDTHTRNFSFLDEKNGDTFFIPGWKRSFSLFQTNDEIWKPSRNSVK